MKKPILCAAKLAVIATLVCIGCAVDPESKSSEVGEFLERFTVCPEYALEVGINQIGAGTVTRSPNKAAYTCEQVTVIATAAAGYAFIGWSGASTSENDTIVFNMDSNKTLTANFEAIYTVIYNGNGNIGGTAPVDANSPYLNRSTVTVLGRNNLERTGYTFNGWNTAADGNGTNHASGAIFSITQNTILYAKWKIDDDDTVTHIPEPSLKAEPVAASNNPSDPKILNSWSDGEKNYYVIDVGVIRKNFISTIFGPEHYDGYHPVSVTIKDINTSTVTTSTTETVSKSIAISNTSGVKMGLEEAIKAGIPGIGDLTVKLNLEVSETVKVDNGKTTTTSVNNIVTYVQSQETSRTMTFGSNGAPAGYYRYALYGVSDVYFVIETSSDNQTLLSWDVISCVRSGDYLRHNDYSSDGNFDNSPSIDRQIVFAEDFYKTLPIPSTSPQYILTTNATAGGNVSRNPNQITYEAGTQVTVTATPNDGYIFNGWTGAPPDVNASNAAITFTIDGSLTLTADFRKVIERRIDTSFTTTDSLYFTFDKGFPATIEVYALGGGGGGQGGHTENWTPFPPVRLCGDGVGGGGGGGGAAYMKLSVEEPVTFKINVGNGGAGGNSYVNGSRWQWDAGHSGNNGGQTSVIWAAKDITLIADGGIRGGNNRTGSGSGNSGGGGGGGAGNKPVNALITDWFSANGEAGAGGNDNNCSSGGGGSAASISNIGSGAPFGGNPRGEGGSGGCGNNTGVPGKNGEVRIIVTYNELL
jgi:uncharacterized repeat protein (TIGR02543 family)